MIAQMQYSMEDHRQHFLSLLPAFRDKRYIRVDGKPLFAVWAPNDIPQTEDFIALWQQLARENGLPGIHFVGYTQNAVGKSREKGKITLWATDQAAAIYKELLNKGYDAVMSNGLSRAQSLCHGKLKMLSYYLSGRTFLPGTLRTDYAKAMEHYYVEEDAWENVYPTLLPQWDRTPRAGIKTDPLINSTPEKFQHSVEQALQLIEKKQPEHQILFLKAWNEWGEGNYVEPDLKFGHGYIQAIRQAIEKTKDR